jgi:hypothetical protein
VQQGKKKLLHLSGSKGSEKQHCLYLLNPQIYNKSVSFPNFYALLTRARDKTVKLPDNIIIAILWMTPITHKTALTEQNKLSRKYARVVKPGIEMGFLIT